MRNTMFYIISVGVSFYAGKTFFPATKIKVVTKETRKCLNLVNNVKIIKKTLNTCSLNLEVSSVKIKDMSDEIKTLNENLDICETRNLDYKEVQDNLHPEEQGYEEPTMKKEGTYEESL